MSPRPPLPRKVGGHDPQLLWERRPCSGTILLLLLYEIVHEVHKKKEGRKKLNYDVQTYSISAPDRDF